MFRKHVNIILYIISSYNILLAKSEIDYVEYILYIVKYFCLI